MGMGITYCSRKSDSTRGYVLCWIRWASGEKLIAVIWDGHLLLMSLRVSNQKRYHSLHSIAQYNNHVDIQ